MLNKIKESSSEIIEDVVKDLHQKRVSYDLALKALEASEGRFSFEELRGYTQEHLNATAALPDASMDDFITTDLATLAARHKNIPGLRWRLPCLNEMFGPIRQGNFGMIIARSNVGKTSFLASEVGNFAEQLNKPILWFNMEQEGHEVAQRVLQATLDLTLTELFADIPNNTAKFKARCGDRLKIYDNAITHKHTVEKLCKIHQPGLIIFDTIDKVKGFDQDREDLRLGFIYQWGRELAKTYGPVITVCQASATGEGKKWLTAEDISNSKTSKISECDFVLGIGKAYDASSEYIRYLQSIKNKLPDAIPDMRHGRKEVILHQETGRYTELV